MRAFCVFALLLGCSGESTVVPACGWELVASASYDLETDCRWFARTVSPESVRLRSADGLCTDFDACGCVQIAALRPHELVEVWSDGVESDAALGLVEQSACH